MDALGERGLHTNLRGSGANEVQDRMKNQITSQTTPQPAPQALPHDLVPIMSYITSVYGEQSGPHSNLLLLVRSFEAAQNDANQIQTLIDYYVGHCTVHIMLSLAFYCLEFDTTLARRRCNHTNLPTAFQLVGRMEMAPSNLHDVGGIVSPMCHDI